MAINIKIGKAEDAPQASEEPKAPSITMSLDIRKTMDGNLIIAMSLILSVRQVDLL